MEEGSPISQVNRVSLDLVERVAEGFASSLFYVVALVVLVYDILLTLEEERVFIWKSRWSPVKCIYILVRYLALVLLVVRTISDLSIGFSACEAVKWIEGVGGVFLEAAADMYLVYRVYALYKGNKYLCFCFIALYIGVQATTFSLVSTLSQDYVSIPNPAPQLRPLLGNCIQFSLTFKITSVWIIYLGFHSILFMCLLLRTVYRCYEAWNNEIRLSLFYIFIRDGSWAYFLIVVSLVLCVVSAFDSRIQYLVGPSVMWLFTITSVCCCHLILNLRIVACNELSLTEDMSLPWQAVSDVRIETGTTSTTTVTSISSTVV